MTAGSYSNQSDPESGWDNRNCGLYLHIPFCLRKCLYCSFFSVPARADLYERYCQAVVQQQQLLDRLDWTGGCNITTIFFGGGTPTVLPVSLLTDLLESFCRLFEIRTDSTEISLEANPATVNVQELADLRRAGFNRLSFGMQSLDDRELQMLGRPHTAGEAQESYFMAREAGFANISLDLMYGLPGQNISSWRTTLEKALALDPEHLSIYELNVEEGTVFADMLRQGKLDLPGEDEVMEMMAMAVEETERKGIKRYEISNYAKKGRECRHNINYWQNGSYWGLGAGAVSCLSGRRFSSIDNIDKFVRKVDEGDPAIGEIELLDREARLRETVIMGLRMIRGISFSDLEKRFDLNVVDYYGTTIERLQEIGLLTVSGNAMRLTERGLVFANKVMAELV